MTFFCIRHRLVGVSLDDVLHGRTVTDYPTFHFSLLQFGF